MVTPKRAGRKNAPGLTGGEVHKQDRDRAQSLIHDAVPVVITVVVVAATIQNLNGLS
jgi:hypothetical protein